MHNTPCGRTVVGRIIRRQAREFRRPSPPFIRKDGPRVIRPLAASDLERIKEIDRAAFPPENQYADEIYGVMLQSGQSVVATDESGLIVGYIFVQILDDWPWAEASDAPQRGPCERHSHLRSVAVDPRHHRRGYGKAMLTSVIRNAVGVVDLLVDEWNDPAVGL